MAIDLERVRIPWLAIVLIAIGIVAYAWWLLVLVRKRGERFFLPGFVTGVIGSLVGIVAARPLPIGVGEALEWLAPLGIVGSWSASRSVLKRLRHRRPLDGSPGPIARTAAAFLTGAILVLVVQFLVLVLLPPVERVEVPTLPPPKTG